MADFLITLFLGFLGIHKFKQGKVGMGILYFFTLGLFGIGWFIDILVAFANMISSPSRTSNTLNSPTSFTRVNGCQYFMGIKNPVNNSLRIIQSIVLPDTRSGRLTNEQILVSCDSYIGNANFIIDDCKDLIEKTENPATFFERYSLLLEKYRTLVQLEPYVEFFPRLPSSSLAYYENIRHKELRHMIDRCYNKALIKADSMKTEKGKHNQFVKAYDSFSQYRHIMSAESQQYLEDKFEAKIS